jgi:hypothetical protein
MISPPLPPEQRQRVLAAVWSTLRATEPLLFAQDRIHAAGGILTLDAHLDELVDMSRHMTADRIEPYLATIIEDVCARCPEQHSEGHCPLRQRDLCVLFSHARRILETIDSMLRALRDPDYLAVHGSVAKAPAKGTSDTRS